MSTPLYSIGTWDTDLQSFTPQSDQESPWLNIDRVQLRTAMRELRDKGYQCHYQQDGDNDSSVMIERTDGIPEEEVLRRWRGVEWSSTLTNMKD